MSLSKIKLANKKAKREVSRRQKRRTYTIQKRSAQARNRKIRKMMLQGMREDQERRRRESEYIEELKGELSKPTKEAK